MAVATKQPLWRRLLRRPARQPEQRAAWVGDDGSWQHHDLFYDEIGANAAQRRAYRTNDDIVSTYAAVYAAIRLRSRMVTRPTIHLMRMRGGEEVEVEDHPALQAIRRVNESLTFRQGMSLIEQHKLGHGASYWVKRRNGLRVPVEFEIWPPSQVEVVPDKQKPWVPAAFQRHKSLGTVETVAPQDVIWFRHMIDPRNPLRALSPIGAVRMEVDTTLEAQRFNQRYFDNDTHIGRVFTVDEAGQGEVQRLEQELEQKFKGTDRAFRAMITPGNLKLVEPTVSHKDMEFLAQQRWAVEEVARVFELTPVSLGDLQKATYSNMEQVDARDWEMIRDQVENTMAEFNEFFIWPDFGEEFRLVARFDNIAALQGDRKLQAEVDEIYLRSGKTVVNEVRERDGQDAVAWGDVPIMKLDMAPLGSVPMVATPAQKQKEAAGEEPRLLRAPAPQGEAKMARNWQGRLKRELDRIIKYLEAADARAIEIGDVDTYDWDWWGRYHVPVLAEIAFAYEQALETTGFIPTPGLSAQEMAMQYARQRGAELLTLDGPESIVNFTRARVRTLTAKTIEEGKSLRWLKNELRADFGFSPSRAEMIARTETATALTKGSQKSWLSQGIEGNEWITSGGDNVCDICAGNSGEIRRIGEAFSSGHDGPPAHPRCVCDMMPVKEMPTE